MRKPKAYLEKAGPEWLDDFVYIARDPLIRRGYDIVPFDGSDMENTLLNKVINPDEDIIVGSVEATVEFFKYCGIEVPKAISYPESLKPYLGRDIVEMNFGDLTSEGYPYFVKPSAQIKLFTGDVVSHDEHLGYLVLNGAEPDTKIFKSTLINFESEYRCFVTKGELRGMKHYLGEFETFPNMLMIHEMIAEFEKSGEAPSAYTLDVGITDEGLTLLVEVNDMWAIGSYGLDGDTYALLCARRMKEIAIKNKIK